ncbi:MAG TPA: STM4015 family protein [Actinospica sp.]|nr:STM4015 family protein [Actinospica sp.]
MSFEEHLTTFAGLPVVEFPVERGVAVQGAEPDAVAWRIRIDDGYGAAGANCFREFAECFDAFRKQVDSTRVKALIIGQTAYQDQFDSEVAVRMPAEHAADFPNLRAIFLADLVREESDVAYIEHDDVMPILQSYPLLEAFHVRGSGGYGWHENRQAACIRPFAHEALRTLVLESGGLSPVVVNAVGESQLPELEHLEFYFGDEDYGGGAGIEDIAWLLAGERFPKLRRLGLRDAPNQDEIAAALAQAPIVARLDALDLSLGTLGDEGAAALLAGQPLTHLKSLDLHHHFMSDEMMRRLREALPGVELDLGEQSSPSRWGGESHRYIAISE